LSKHYDLEYQFSHIENIIMNTVEKTLVILEAFLNEEQEIGLSRLADLTGLNISIVHRIISTLVKKGYIIQPFPRAKYSLGPKLLKFGSLTISRVKIRNIALPFMKKLNREINECVNLAILDSDEAVYIECVEPDESNYKLRIFTQLGARVPLYCTGVGKVLLAYMTEKEWEQYFSERDLSHRTPNTITDYKQFEKELLYIKQDGFSVDNEEMELGVRCIAAPVRDHNGNVVATVSISGPTTRLTTPKIRQFESMIKDCASDISHAMGYIAE